MIADTLLHSDFCCYRACLATVLRWYGCASPELVLGNGSLASARRVGAYVRFSDDFVQLSVMCQRRGYSCSRRAGFGSDAWRETVGQLAAGRPVIALLDPYYLSHFWANYQRTHKLHAVILWSLEDGGRAIHLSDPCELSYFNAVVQLQTVEGSWLEQNHGQSYIDLLPSADSALPSRGVLFRELRQHLRDLTEDGEHLACLSLATFVRDRLDVYLELVARMHEPGNRTGADDRRRHCSHFLGGLRSFHNTLRWFAAFAATLLRDTEIPNGGARVAELEDIAQSWLVIRNLLMKYGLSESDRRGSLDSHCRYRLVQLVESVERLAPAMGQAVEELAVSRCEP